MEQSDDHNEFVSENAVPPQTTAIASPPAPSARATVTPQRCATCGTVVTPQDDAEDRTNVNYPFVYALGQVEIRFPSLAVEKEFAQATGRSDTAGMTDRQVLQSTLSQRQSRYLARKLCWVLTVEGLETYILIPRDSSDLDILIEAIRPTPNLEDVDIVVGLRGPIAPADACNGLMVPIVVVDQIYSFDKPTLIKSIPKPDAIKAEEFETASQELFDRIMQMADNAGATDEHRALNYLAVRYPVIYAQTAEAFARSASLTAVEARDSRLSGIRKIVDVIFSYTNRTTDVMERFFVRVDVTEEFPFLVTKLSPYYDR